MLALGVVGCGQQPQPQTQTQAPAATETKTEQSEVKTNWIEAGDVKAAAKGAGLEDFNAFESVKFNDTEYKNPKFAYADGVAQATYDGGAHELILREGANGHKATVTDRNLSEFATKWTQSFEGADVTLYGAEKGKATVITFSFGGSDFGVTYQGLGGEEVSLDDQDVNAIIGAVKRAGKSEESNNNNSNNNQQQSSNNNNSNNNQQQSNNNSQQQSSNNNNSGNNSGSNEGPSVKYDSNEATNIALEYFGAGGAAKGPANNVSVSGPIEGGGTTYYAISFTLGDAYCQCNVDATDGHIYAASETANGIEHVLDENGDVEFSYDHNEGEQVE